VRNISKTLFSLAQQLNDYSKLPYNNNTIIKDMSEHTKTNGISCMEDNSNKSDKGKGKAKIKIEDNSTSDTESNKRKRANIKTQNNSTSNAGPSNYKKIKIEKEDSFNSIAGPSNSQKPNIKLEENTTITDSNNNTEAIIKKQEDSISNTSSRRSNTPGQIVQDAVPMYQKNHNGTYTVYDPSNLSARGFINPVTGRPYMIQQPLLKHIREALDREHRDNFGTNLKIKPNLFTGQTRDYFLQYLTHYDPG